MYAAKILVDSITVRDCRLTTFEVTFPRFILAEFNTHRALSRNSASSRAIPIQKRIDAIRAHGPFMPEAFGKNKRGMQADGEFDGPEGLAAAAVWVEAAAFAVVSAEKLAAIGVHKQHAARLLEPFLWHTAVASATEWDNFFHLRDHPAAQPEFQIIAKMMREAMEASRPTLLAPGQWHLPYVDAEDYKDPKFGHDWESMAMISTARCARVSYKPFDADTKDTVADVRLGLKLMVDGHMSPFEHPAVATGGYEHYGNFIGWKQWRKFIPHEHDRLKPMTVIPTGGGDGLRPNPPVTSTLTWMEGQK